jgi:beta-phosphoglucomutase-like phosphatase (HAD superfamily)
VAVVSNTLCGAAHRDFLARAGLDGLFATQVYSDEVGVRKPNPEMARLAARRLQVAIEDCWFVGDSPVRDLACARRAGVSTAILMRARRTAGEQALGGHTADATIDDGHGLLALIDAARIYDDPRRGETGVALGSGSGGVEPNPLSGYGGCNRRGSNAVARDRDMSGET